MLGLASVGVCGRLRASAYQGAGGAIDQSWAVNIAQASEVDVVQSHVFVGGQARIGGAQTRGDVGARGELWRGGGSGGGGGPSTALPVPKHCLNVLCHDGTIAESE